ncbi:MAG: MarR family winged helix-turn-helix transcriptional regulator [Pleomorphochaeta sp.]|jgi:DNA-binding MarR family transcriptional regulator
MEQDLNCELIQSIFQLKKMMHKGFGFDPAHKKISATELIIMNEIIHNTKDPEGNVKISDIKGFLSFSKGAVSQKLASLEKKGYIQRTINKNNRRNIIVTLTPEGHNLMKQHYAGFTNKLSQIISRLGEDNVKQMILLINKMIEITEDINNEATQDK